MSLSEEQTIVLAKAVNNNGIINHQIVASSYATKDKSRYKTIMNKFMAMGFVRKIHDAPGKFMLKVKETGNKLVYCVPEEVVEIAENLRDMRTSEEEQNKLLEKYRSKKV